MRSVTKWLPRLFIKPVMVWKRKFNHGRSAVIIISSKQEYILLFQNSLAELTAFPFSPGGPNGPAGPVSPLKEMRRY